MAIEPWNYHRGSVKRRMLKLLASGVLKFCVQPITRSCGDVIYYRRYVEELEFEITWLCRLRNTLREQVDKAKREKRSISPEVESWLAEVDAFEELIRRFINDVKSRKHLYDPMARYSLSRRSVDIYRQIVERYEEGSRFHNVTDPAPPPRIGSTFVRVLNPEFSTPN